MAEFLCDMVKMLAAPIVIAFIATQFKKDIVKELKETKKEEPIRKYKAYY